MVVDAFGWIMSCSIVTALLTVKFHFLTQCLVQFSQLHCEFLSSCIVPCTSAGKEAPGDWTNIPSVQASCKAVDGSRGEGARLNQYLQPNVLQRFGTEGEGNPPKLGGQAKWVIMSRLWWRSSPSLYGADNLVKACGWLCLSTRIVPSDAPGRLMLDPHGVSLSHIAPGMRRRREQPRRGWSCDMQQFRWCGQQAPYGLPDHTAWRWKGNRCHLPTDPTKLPWDCLVLVNKLPRKW